MPTLSKKKTKLSVKSSKSVLRDLRFMQKSKDARSGSLSSTSRNPVVKQSRLSFSAAKKSVTDQSMNGQNSEILAQNARGQARSITPPVMRRKRTKMSVLQMSADTKLLNADLRLLGHHNTVVPKPLQVKTLQDPTNQAL